ncbi:vacuolar protein sorting 54 family protein [Cavenderia fasciculata]|uniref:Vacuolar protein sorting-associated protein 54 n=1 Tax=Cavenderia fasciculata TaxID=261658 RepID=F4Q9I9_CACFS|nr:vacuolar protein sorting 54 family protein [Cavenderia fasciculata]EGG15358.1 vacuolar protein sorting 54 family protein [Cavenderia fasciculata]|eukprot:XP_004354100.1 vacuolar protein sorting 54 family protein [Cavenderia fasciculata]
MSNTNHPSNNGGEYSSSNSSSMTQHKRQNSYGYRSPVNSTLDNNNNNKNKESSIKRSPSEILFQQHNDEPFVFAQSLTSVCLDPMAPLQNEWAPSDLVIPPLSTSMPNISAQSFQSYLTKIAAVYKIFHENQSKDLLPSNKKTPEEIISLENIPEFFFKPNLSKSQILEYADSDPSPILFQKLEHYSSIIEENIVGHVRDKFLDFFNAMHELKQFRSELKTLYVELKSARDILNKVDNEVVKSSLNISRLYLQKNRTLDTLNKLTLVSDVKQAQPTLQLLLSKGDYGGALDLIQSTQEVLSGNLTPISSLRNLSPQLAEMVKLIDKMMENDFNRLVLNDDIIFNVGQQQQQDNTSQSQDNVEEQFRNNVHQSLLPIVMNVLRNGRVHECLESFRVAAIDSVSQLYQVAVEDGLHKLENQKNPSSSDNARAHHAYNWGECNIKLLKLSPVEYTHLFTHVHKIFKRKLTLIRIILDLIIQEGIKIQEINSSPPPQTQQHVASPKQTSPSTSSTSPSSQRNQLDNIKLICIEILNNINEATQDRFGALIKTRLEINSKLPLTEFVQLNQEITGFIQFLEGLLQNKKKATSLRSMQLTQLKLFLDAFHKHKISHITLILENEEWIPVIVASEFQNIIDNIVNLSLEPSDSPPSSTPPLSSTTDNNNQNNNNNSNNNDNQQETTIREDISLSGEKFKIGNTTLMLLKFIDDYLNCIEKIPMLAVDSIPKIAELLNTFNGITYQLVLGAGARQIMRTKTITSKHLGLTSQCLSFLVKLIPYLKTYLQRFLPSKNQYALLNNFDKLTQDYTSHRSEIFSKFIDIVKERSINHLKALSALDLKDDNMPIPSPPFSSLIKDISTLHKVLMTLLPPDHIFKVFTNIYYMINNLLIECFPKLENISSKAAKRRIHNDVLHLMASLRKLQYAGDPGNVIEDYIQTHMPI